MDNIISNQINNENIIHCNRVVGYNTSGDQVAWVIFSTSGKRLHLSDVFQNNETWTFDLSTLNLRIGSQIKISCMSPSFSGTMDNEEILTYTPDSNATAYYQFDLDSHHLKLTYNGVVPPYYYPNNEPYLKSSGVIIKNSSVTLCKYTLYSLENVKLFESDRFSEGETATINFNNTGIEEYALFKLKASVIAGSDSGCEIIMQYIPDSYYVGKFQLYGITVNTTLVFKGSNSLIPDPSLVINSDQIVAYNDSNMGVKFQVILLDGTKIYESDKKYQWDQTLINLNNLNLVADTYVRLKVILLAKDLVAENFIKYSPNTNAAYYKVVGKSSIPNTHDIYYYDALSSETTPPLLKCSTIVSHNYSEMITKWSFISNGKTIYTSGRCRMGNTSTLNLEDILPANTRFLLKSNAIAGADSTAYVTIEYDPSSNVTAEFEFDGSVMKTIVMYEGTK